jgi:Transposase DDE domain
LAAGDPDRRLRLVVASTDPARLPGHSTWYLLTNLHRPATRRAQQANLAEVVRLYGLRNRVEQGYKQVKGELGWADFQVRSDRAIRRHWALVCCAFSFCWQAFLAEDPNRPALPDPAAAPTVARGAMPTGHRRRTRRQELVADGVASGAGLADPMERIAALLAVVVASAAAPAAARAA